MTKTVKTPEDVKSAEIQEEKPVSAPKKQAKRKFADSDPILCVSITSGKLAMIGPKTRIDYTWTSRGDACEVEYQDLVAAIRSSKKHITQPYFIIQDEEFLDQFPKVKEIYNSMYSINDLKDVFKMSPAQMKKTISSLPDGAKESIKNIASSMITNGTLDSVQKIKVLDELFDTKFMLMTELFD